MKASRALVGAAGLVAVLTLVSRLMGLVRKIAQSWALSDGPVATAYDTANTVPNVLFEVAAGGALAGAIIPLLSRYLSQGKTREADQTASALLTWISAIGIPLAAMVAIAAGPIVSFLLPDSDPAIRAVASTLLRIFAIQVPLYGLSVVATGVLQSHGHFVLPALSPLLSSLAVSAAFLGYSTIADPFADPSTLSWSALALLGWGTTAGVVLFSLPQLLLAGRYARLRPTMTFPPGAGRHTVRLGLAGLAALLAQQIAIIAIMVTANGLGDVGTYAAFNYSYAIFMVPYAVLAVPIATVVFPQISAATGERLQILTAQSTRLVFAMGMVSAALLFVLAEPAKIVLEMGRDITGIDTALRAMSLGLVGFSLLYHGARVLYAQNAPGRVIASNTLAWGGVVVGLIIAYTAGVEGRTQTLNAIGFTMSGGLTIGAVAVLAMIRSVVGSHAIRGIGRLGAILAPALAVAGAAALWLTNTILEAGSGTILSAILAAVVGALILLGTAALCIYVADRGALSSLSKSDSVGE